MVARWELQGRVWTRVRRGERGWKRCGDIFSMSDLYLCIVTCQRVFNTSFIWGSGSVKGAREYNTEKEKKAYSLCSVIHYKTQWSVLFSVGRISRWKQTVACILGLLRPEKVVMLSFGVLVRKNINEGALADISKIRLFVYSHIEVCYIVSSRLSERAPSVIYFPKQPAAATSESVVQRQPIERRQRYEHEYDRPPMRPPTCQS